MDASSFDKLNANAPGWRVEVSSLLEDSQEYQTKAGKHNWQLHNKHTQKQKIPKSSNVRR